MAQTRLQPVEVPEFEQPQPAAAAKGQQAAFANLLVLSLKALSQRAIVALASLVDLALIASAFVLWLNVMAQPNILQLVGVGMYAAFILAALWARKR